MPLSKLPSDVGKLDPRLREWLSDRGDVAARGADIIDITFPTAPNTAVRVRHRKTFVPQGFRVRFQDQAGSIYLDTAQPADKFYMYLKASVASLVAGVEFE